MAELDGRLEKAEDVPYGTHILIEQLGTRFALRAKPWTSPTAKGRTSASRETS
jgi:hypothetical protein